jgi:hypothetical protein
VAEFFASGRIFRVIWQIPFARSWQQWPSSAKRARRMLNFGEYASLNN